MAASEAQNTCAKIPISCWF